MGWALIIFFHVGMLGDTDSNATTVVHGFTTPELCAIAAKQVNGMTKFTKKEVVTLCVRTK